MSRIETLDRELKRFIALLASDESYKKAILFGSAASGEIHEESDIDLVIIQDTSKPFWRRMREIRREWDPHIGTDVLVYTSDEFALLCKERPFFRDEIQAKGKVIYERD